MSPPLLETTLAVPQKSSGPTVCTFVCCVAKESRRLFLSWPVTGEKIKHWEGDLYRVQTSLAFFSPPNVIRKHSVGSQDLVRGLSTSAAWKRKV